MDNIIEMVQDETEELRENSFSLSKFDYLRITKEREIEKPVPTFFICDAPFAVSGNISSISAQVKAGKTAIRQTMLTAATSPTGKVEDFPEITAEPNFNRYAIIDIDTEQSEADHQYLIDTALRRNKITETPENLLSYNFRRLSLADYKTTLKGICEAAKRQFNGVYIIIVDGGADFLTSVNDEKESRQLIEFLTHLSIEYACPVVVVIHQNPGSEKERGHFGSDIQRKCFALVSISKEGDISTIQPKAMRKAGGADMPLISFQYNREKGYHVSIGTVNKEGEKDRQKRENHYRIAKEALLPLTSYRHTDLVKALMSHTDKADKTVRTMIINMTGWGIIEKSQDGLYRLIQ